jgi:REP element-mobilizing transposase RayT
MQQKLGLEKGRWGGRRLNSGRKRIKSKGVAHRIREKISARTPMHINFKYRTQVRNKQTLRLLKKAILNSRKHGLRILHFSFQTNHVHLIIEADTNAILTKGMRSLTVTMAKGLSKGRVQIERYHLHVLRTLREARNAITYVLFNQQKHEKGTCSTIDGFTSVLSLENGLALVKEYGRRKKMVLKINCEEFWRADVGKSWLGKRGHK